MSQAPDDEPTYPSENVGIERLDVEDSDGNEVEACEKEDTRGHCQGLHDKPTTVSGAANQSTEHGTQ